MSCERCAPFATTLPIRGPADLAAITEHVRQAVADGRLEYAAFETEPTLAIEPSFLTLDLAGPLPDVIRYQFACPCCGQGFEITAETYHGVGGSWRPIG